MHIQPGQLLSELQAEMKKCRKCLQEGFEIYPPAVFSGQGSADFMTIGQAPGITEQEAERPFNAGSGTRLFGWLERAGINEEWFRSTQYMSSVTKCYPGRQPSGNGDRVPTRREQEICRPFLDQEIEIVNPLVIIPIGRLAINLFYPKKIKLSEIIGTQQEIEGRWIIPLPHSSGASRWHQIDENRLLISNAISLIKKHREKILPA
ncbi:MAG: uracil-DNA glycosylase family protein [Anaerolineales bacterium]|nr:uracil-DNA glycosylase family protein [Anaerolineales bacterium]